jgi:hypothetical protein
VIVHVSRSSLWRSRVRGDASVLLASWSCIRKLLPGCLTR